MEANELSEREREILQLVATGASNKEIAQRLVISPNTVKVHLRNIFTKIGVASRTEAAMVALRSNIVQSSVTPATGEATIPPVEVAPPTPVQAETFLPTKRRSNLRLWIILAILFLLGSGSLWILFNLVSTTRANQSVAEAADALSQPPRWLKLTNMPSARSGLAAVVYGNLIYTFGGTSLTGVTGAVECYEPDKERWLIYTSKPTPVTDIQAAVIGGRIYIPGGKTTAGQPTDILEIYNPLNDTWEQGTNLPVPLSAYSLAAFEGRLFIFGGWNGEEFTASVYEYDFNRGLWVERTPMPTARSYTSAAVAGRKIYVLGGYNKDGALPTNEVYSPDWESSVNTPWAKAASLPEGRYGMGALSIADIIYLVGGKNEQDVTQSLEYFPQVDEWQGFDAPLDDQLWAHMGLVEMSTIIYAFGGQVNEIPTAYTLAYKAMYSVVLPLIR